jgi:hypothetical protein
VAPPRKLAEVDDSPPARLAQALQALNVTQAEVGRRTKVGAPYVNDVLRGRRPVSEPFAEYLQTEFGIDKIWLRYGEGQMFRRLPPSAATVGGMGGVGLAQLPLLDRPCAGNPLDSVAWLGSTHPVPRSLANPSVANRYRYVVRVAGCGASGEIRDGDVVLVENFARSAPGDLAGSCCVVADAGVGKIQRITKSAQNRLEIWGRCIGLLWRGLH